jgi:UDP-N-acetylglucosamine transferase subunit ALG13
MILVILGTWKMPFSRPLKEIERLIESGVIKEEVIVQAGVTQFHSTHMDIHAFFDKDEFERLYRNASLIITHAGVGSIILGLKYKKKVISIARLLKYNEHIDNHQLEILNEFSLRKYLLAWEEGGDLEILLNRLNAFTPMPYPFSEDRISERIIDFIDGDGSLKFAPKIN